MASLRQIHSDRCLMAATPACIGEGDALVTCSPGLGLSIRTADCFPILLADTGHRAIAAIHAGWRGTALGIVGAVLKRMHVEFKTHPEVVFAAIGPGIGKCCYEVAEDVASRFGDPAARRIDLAATNRAQLIAAGVPESQIDVLGLCTFCDPERFHSFRRDKDRAGRMVSYIRLIA
jgi:YfiH family protein